MDFNEKHELKIIANFAQNDKFIKSPNVIIYLDGEPVGAVQEFKFNVSAKDYLADIEITFPDLHSEKIDKTWREKSNLMSSVDEWISKFRSIFGIKVKLLDIFKDE